MSTLGLLVKLEAKKGQEGAVERFLGSALDDVRRETGTTAWFAIRFGGSEYGIFDVFPDEASREAHMTGTVAKAIAKRGDELLAKPPEIHKVDVLADKLPTDRLSEPDRKGLLLTMRPRAGKEQELATFLRDAKAFVDQEEKTTSWFAIRFDNGDYGIFDVFPDNGGRFRHLAGRVPRALLKRGRLLGGLPQMDFIGIEAEKLPAERVTA